MGTYSNFQTFMAGCLHGYMQDCANWSPGARDRGPVCQSKWMCCACRRTKNDEENDWQVVRLKGILCKLRGKDLHLWQTS